MQCRYLHIDSNDKTLVQFVLLVCSLHAQVQTHSVTMASAYRDWSDPSGGDHHFLRKTRYERTSTAVQASNLAMSGENGFVFVEWLVFPKRTPQKVLRKHESQVIQTNDLRLTPEHKFWCWVPECDGQNHHASAWKPVRRVLSRVVDKPMRFQVENFKYAMAMGGAGPSPFTSFIYPPLASHPLPVRTMYVPAVAGPKSGRGGLHHCQRYKPPYLIMPRDQCSGVVVGRRCCCTAEVECEKVKAHKQVSQITRMYTCIFLIELILNALLVFC